MSSKELTVFQKMTSSTDALIKTIQGELKVKGCIPFAVRALDALNSLEIANEDEAKKAANTFLDNLQTLVQGGILTEDYDKLDFVKRGKVITISARVQALIRAAKRKGFILLDTIVAVPKDDDIYFEENYKDGVGIIYLLKDKRVNTDREITAERLVDGYFSKFLCRLEVIEIKSNRRLMTTIEMSNSDVMYAQSSSDNGIFKSKWVDAVDEKGEPIWTNKAKGWKKRVKVIANGMNGIEKELNEDSFWIKWTEEMVKKTVLRRALKNLKEALPELEDVVLAFDADTTIEEDTLQPKEGVIIIDGFNNVDIDLYNLSEEQQLDVEEVLEIYSHNPANAKQDAELIKSKYENNIPLNEIINEHYAELVNLAKSKKLYPLIENIVKGVPYEKN